MTETFFAAATESGSPKAEVGSLPFVQRLRLDKGPLCSQRLTFCATQVAKVAPRITRPMGTAMTNYFEHYEQLARPHTVSVKQG